MVAICAIYLGMHSLQLSSPSVQPLVSATTAATRQRLIGSACNMPRKAKVTTKESTADADGAAAAVTAPEPAAASTTVPARPKRGTRKEVSYKESAELKEEDAAPPAPAPSSSTKVSSAGPTPKRSTRKGAGKKTKTTSDDERDRDVPSAASAAAARKKAPKATDAPPNKWDAYLRKLRTAIARVSLLTDTLPSK